MNIAMSSVEVYVEEDKRPIYRDFGHDHYWGTAFRYRFYTTHIQYKVYQWRDWSSKLDDIY